MRIVGRPQWVALVLGLVGLPLGAGAATLFHDHFDREDGPVENGWVVAGGGHAGIVSNELRFVTGGDAGYDWISRDASAFGPGYATTFDEATNALAWRVAFTSSRDSLGGFDAGSYGMALVLGASSPAFADPGVRGYALVLGNAGSPDPLRLQYFTDGLGSNAALDTNVAPVLAVWNPGPGEFDGNEAFTVMVVYAPASDSWTLMASTNAAVWPTPGAADFVGRGTHAALDELPHFGLFFSHSSGAHYGRWDEVAVLSLAPAPTLQAVDLDVVDIQEASAVALWEAGNGQGRLVVAKEGAPVDAFPVPGQRYTPSSTFGQGADLGDGNFAMVSGDAADEPLDGFRAGTVYHLRVFEYALHDGNWATVCYNTNAAAGNPWSFQTAGLAPDPTSVIEASPAPSAGGTLVTTDYTNPASPTALFAFTVVDAGTTDGLETEPTTVVITPGAGNSADWAATLGGVVLWNETDGEPVTVDQAGVTPTGIVFRVAAGALRVPNGERVDLTLRTYLRPAGLADRSVLVFAVPVIGHGWQASSEGSQFAPVFPSNTVSASWTLDVRADRTAFERVPEAVCVGHEFLLSALAIDGGGNVDRDATGVAMVTAGEGAVRLRGGPAADWQEGRAAWSGLRAGRAGEFRLRVAAPGMIPQESGLIVAKPGLPAGAIAFVGLLNNATSGPDLFAFAALEWLPAGTVIYFTDDGWGNGAFRGAGPTDGNGGEDLLAFTAKAPIPPGTIVQAYTDDPAYAWSTNGPIPGAGGTTWSGLAFSQAGDQVVAFISAVASNPLYRAESMGALYQLDYTGAFEPAADASTGDLVRGCEAGRTALALPLAPVWSLRFDGRARSPREWQQYIADTNHWVAATEGPLPRAPFAVAPPRGLMLTVW